MEKWLALALHFAKEDDQNSIWRETQFILPELFTCTTLEDEVEKNSFNKREKKRVRFMGVTESKLAAAVQYKIY